MSDVPAIRINKGLDETAGRPHEQGRYEEVSEDKPSASISQLDFLAPSSLDSSLASSLQDEYKGAKKAPSRIVGKKKSEVDEYVLFLFCLWPENDFIYIYILFTYLFLCYSKLSSSPMACSNSAIN